MMSELREAFEAELASKFLLGSIPVFLLETTENGYRNPVIEWTFELWEVVNEVHPELFTKDQAGSAFAIATRELRHQIEVLKQEKAQQAAVPSVPEGFVVVPINSIKELISWVENDSHHYEYCSNEQHHGFIKQRDVLIAAVKAQEKVDG